MHLSSVQERIRKNPQLDAIYGRRGTADGHRPLSEGEVMLRTPDQAPALPGDIQAAKMIEATEKLLKQGGLESLGVPTSTINKLRSLEGLAIGSGIFLVQSLQHTHAIYYVNLMKLDAMAEDIKRRYLDENATEKCEDMMTRMFWQRAYNEIVDQLRKGYECMLAGTQALAAIERAHKKNNPTGPGKKADPGW
jgi:hypothetical protein